MPCLIKFTFNLVEFSYYSRQADQIRQTFFSVHRLIKKGNYHSIICDVNYQQFKSKILKTFKHNVQNFIILEIEIVFI